MKGTTICSVFALVFVVLAAFVSGDDTEGLRFALKTLCDVNKEGVFAQCCKSHPAESVVIDNKDTWSCYMNTLSAEDSAITFLDFGSKGLTNLGIGAFSSLTNLLSLDFSSSEFTSIKKGAFDGLTNLLVLDMRMGRLQEIESGVFDNLENVLILHLFRNNISAFPAGIFDHLSNIYILTYDYNHITAFPTGLFDRLTTLYAMDMSANPLKTLSPGVFGSLTKMALLLAHSSGYKDFAEGVFPKNSELLVLDLDNNEFSSIQPTTFSDLTKLQVLSLNSNSLVNITPGVFTKNYALSDLSFQGNGITVIPDAFFDDFTKLNFLDLSKNSLTYINMGNLTPETFFLNSNYLVSYSQEAAIIASDTIRMALELDNNCLLNSQIPAFRSSYFHLFADDESRCPENLCKEELRLSGCFECTGDVCNSCLNGYILYNGTCVACDDSDDCPFGNTNEIYCVDNDDLSHCPISDAVACADHVCVDDVCLHGEFGVTKQCEIGGIGCKGCYCMEGWYPKKAKDCESICGDGFVVGQEECDGSVGCNNQTCKCADGYEFVQHGPRKKCVLKTSSSDNVNANVNIHTDLKKIKDVKGIWRMNNQLKLKWKKQQEKEEL